MRKNWSCSTLDTKVAVEYRHGVLNLMHAAKVGEVENRIFPAPVAFPGYYSLGEEKVDNRTAFTWELRREFATPEGFSLLFCDDIAGCAYKLEFKARGDMAGPVEISANLTNTGEKTIRIYPGDIFSADFTFSSIPTAWRITKESGLAENVRWHLKDLFFGGPGIYKDKLDCGCEVVAETNTNQDFNRGGMIPIVYLDENSMRGSYVAFEWTSSRIKAHANGKKVNISIDFREGFTTCLPAGSDLLVPPIYFGLYDGDVDEGSNIFKKWFSLEKSPKVMRYDKNEPLTQMDQQIGFEVDGLGIQSVKWDYGWWSEEKLDSGWKPYEGSWKLRASDYLSLLERYHCKSMAEFGRLAKEKGLNWTVYILLHDSRKDLGDKEGLTSIGEKGHPEWFSNRRIGGECPVADLGNQACVDFCKQKLFEFITKNNIGTWRSDFEPIAHFSDKKNRHDANGSDVQYWCSRGFYEIVDYLLEAIPGFRYESCSSGGSMKDFATMRRAVVINNDDSSNFHSLRTTFYDASFCIPPAQLQSPVNPANFCPESKYYMGPGNKDFGMRAMIMGAVMFGSWDGTGEDGHLTHELESFYTKYLKLYNEKIKPIIRDGNLYHILPRPDRIHWDGIQYGRTDKPENHVGGVCFLFKPTNEEGETMHIKVRGLNPDLIYRAEFYERPYQNFTACGSELMKKGFACTIEATCGSEIVFLMVE